MTRTTLEVELAILIFVAMFVDINKKGKMEGESRL